MLPGWPPRGWSCFPAIRKNGHRCSRSWQTLSTNDAATVAGWWAKWPGAVPALDLARCGLVVLDGDRHHAGVDGVAALRELLRHQPGLDAKALPMVKTPRDGVHVYFRQCRPALTNSRGSLPAGIDVRGAGGYVIAPGAMLGNRRGYVPIEGQPELAAAFAAKSIPEVPAGIVDLIRPAPHRAAASSQRRDRPAGARERAYAKAALRRIASELAGAPRGSRNEALNKAAFVLGTMVAREWISAQEVEDALAAAMERNGYLADKGSKAIAATLASGLKAGMANPHDDLPERGHPARRLRQPRPEPHLFFPAVPRAVARRQRQRPAAPYRSDDGRRRAEAGFAERLARPAPLASSK